jgi:hypothetical protein
MNIPDSQIRVTLLFDANGNQCRLPQADIWAAIVEHLRRFGCCPAKMSLNMDQEDGISLNFDDLSPEAVHRHLAEQKYGGFHTSNLRYRRKFFNIDLGVHRFTDDPPKLQIYGEPGQKFPTSWNTMIESLAAIYPIRSAWQYEFQYTRWQDMNRLDRWRKEWGEVPAYKRTEQDIAGLKVTWLDISKNPGRTITQDWKPQSVAAEMWLGPGFWPYAPCTKEEVLAADFFIEKRDTPHYLYLKSWPHPFTRPDGEQGRVQQKLWLLLYHKDCEWPPGSGGISDVPVGGPPELMP